MTSNWTDSGGRTSTVEWTGAIQTTETRVERHSMCVAGHVADARTQRKALRGRLLILGAALFPTRLLLFLAIFLWHILAVDPRCLFYAQNDLFLCNSRFLRDFLVVPGGAADWLGRLVLQTCHFGWPGALILTGLAWLICVFTMGFLKRLSASISPFRGDWEIVWAVPAIVLLVVHSQYDWIFSRSIGAALAVGAALAYAEAAVRWPRWRVVGFAGLAAALYYLAGVSLYVFALCSMIYEFYSSGRRWATTLSLIAAAVGVRCGVKWILDAFHPGLCYLHVPSLQFFREELSLSAVALAFYATFPMCALLTADRTTRAVRGDPGPAQAAITSQDKGATRARTPKAATVLLLAIAITASQLSLRRSERAVLTLHESAEEEKWEEVLRLSARVPPHAYSQFVVHDVNMALYHAGRLPWDMFLYRQFPEPFVSRSDIDPYALRRRRLSDFHLELGRPNDAEFLAHEDFMARPSAQSLRQLARITVVKGRTEVARLFLNVLRDDLVYGKWADDWLRRLADDPDFSQDPYVANLRAAMVADDNLYYATAPAPALLLSVSAMGQMSPLLRHDPPNRMAFEYTMARYLVMRDVETVVRLLPRAASFGYPDTPPLYEEAAMIFARIGKEKHNTSGPEVVINGCRISQPTLSKVRQLDAATDLGGVDSEEMSRVAGELGLTYFRYYYRQDNGT
jgi:hypothetical protein